VLIRKLFIKSNGLPRPWVKRRLFSDSFEVKPFWRFIVFSRGGRVREIFSEWYQSVCENPSPKADPEWVNARKILIGSKAFKDCRCISIISPRATIYVARMLEWNLIRWGVDCQVSENMPIDFSDNLYIVICPQMYKRLPPRQVRISYQMEQSVTDRWFTDEYFNILYNSIAVFDYSQENMLFLANKVPELNNLYHVPIESLPADTMMPLEAGDACADQFQYDIVFYGDAKIPRRKKFLNELSKCFSTRIINGIYGPDLWAELRKARLVVNIHYYENALLETTRINECLSLGLTVISETASDQHVHHDLSDRVVFTPINDISAMVEAIRRQLLMPSQFSQKVTDHLSERGMKLRAALHSLGITVAKKTS